MVVPPYLVLMYRNSSAFSRKLQEQLEKKAAFRRPFVLCLAHLLAAAQVHGAVGHSVQRIQALACALGHAGDSALGHHGVDAGAG